ncbi:MAG: efflux RND transporter periplasmic adaptor subunit [Bacteroidales bacterium]|jgi:HlyD family secretion protein|nr:efflux RND transporter periplasmic adaptor subunit [Bacteroidales bacterium]
MKKKIIIGSIILVIIVGVVIVAFSGGGHELRMNTAVIGKETVELNVTATGYVQPVDQVEVGTQVSGVIEKIFVDYNSHVTKGQILAELDKSTLSEKVSQGEASVESAESDLTYAQQNYDRVKQLYEAKAATQASYEEATNRLAQAATALVNAKANLHQAQVNFSYAEIYSPIDGVVLDRAVEQGQTVAASFSTPTLFTIANDLKNMQVEADVDEADIGQVKEGQKVTFTVDAYPDDIFEGNVKQVRLLATVTSNVVTYTVIIDAPNPEEKLFPGMTASVTIVTQSSEGAAVPAEALNFNPSAEIMGKVHIIPGDTPPGQEAGKVAPAGMKAGNGAGSKPKGVWVKNEEGIKWVAVKTGLNDGVYYIVDQGLNLGDTVVLSASLEKKTKDKGAAASNPLMPRPPGRR